MAPTTASAPAASPLTVHVIHDNPEWIPTFATALEARDIEVVEWLLPDTTIDLSQEPPQGLYWSRLSASSHTRTDPHVKEYGRALLAWLEAAGRTVLNGAHVYELEVSKVLQHRRLETRGFSAPRTVAALGAAGLADAVRTLDPPFITKHNQGGKGLGVRRFDSHAEFDALAHEFAPGGDNAPNDGITLAQEYVRPAQPFITRAEFIGGRFHYAVRVDVSAGSFELCPAEACEIPQPGISTAVCAVPAPEGTSPTTDATTDPEAVSGSEAAPGPEAASGPSPVAPQPTGLFTLREDLTRESPLIQRLEAFLAEQRIDIAGIEFIDTADGDQVTYDINTNTNYNPAVESAETSAGRLSAADRIAEFIAHELAELATASGEHAAA
ncbi:MAG TPA: alpha-L-glutamate ligase [Brevibacterium sp.]|nr:alpha-L-glutamate ligase [Brevibacterium sp.]